MSMSSFRINVLEDVQVAWWCLVSHFLRFLQAGYRSSCLISSSLDSDSSYDILNLRDVADVSVANSIAQSVASDAPAVSVVLYK